MENDNKVNETLKFIRDNVPEERRLTQFAEECSEGAHAALKLFRSYTGNEPHLSEGVGTYRLHLLEEMADILVCMDVIMNDLDRVVLSELYTSKLKRWEARLNAANKS